jgi:anthranilate synthase component I
VNDPWTEFTRRAVGAEVAGYFETAPHRGLRPARATFFDRAEEVLMIDRRTDLSEAGRRCDRFLEGNRSRGVMGYLGFDAVGLVEPALASFPGGSPFPLGEFALPGELRVRRVPPRAARVSEPGVVPAPGRPISDSLPRRNYTASVRRIVRDIRDGEAFQVVLAHRRAWRRPPDLVERAGRLRATERFAFFYYLRFGDRELVGATPESVVEVARSRAFVNPIAGTLPHGTSRVDRLPLRHDPKELAEHRMLVDLARNDLGRVGRPGTVHLLWQERRERYARLEHLVSRVTTRLAPGVDPWTTLAATFPAGTVSGAPKIRAAEILRREEGSWRGPYAGTVGLLRPRGRADWALLIRSGFAAGPRLYSAAGAGIVHRSEPDREYDETLAKLAHVEATLAGGGR